MIDSALLLAGSIIYLASSLGVLAIVVLWILPEMYSNWKEIKHGVDVESAVYESVVAALELAEGRPVRIVLDEESDDEQLPEEK